MTGKQLRKKRMKAKLTQRQLADRLDVSIKTIQAWEGGWRNIPVWHIREIKRVLR